MSNDWTNKLRDRLADYEEPVMDDLWAGIEQSLAQQAPALNHISTQQTPIRNNASARQVWMRRFSMAAAIAALAVGGTYVYLHPWDEVKSIKEVAAVEKQAAGSQTKKKDFEGKQAEVEKVDNTIFSQEKAAVKSTGLIAQVRNVFSGEPDEGMLSYSLEDNQNATRVQNEPERQNTTDEQNDKKSRKAKLSAADPLSVATTHDTYDAPVFAKKNSASSWSIQFYGENGIIPSNGNTNNIPLMASADPVPPSFFGNGDNYNDIAGVEYTGVYDSKLLKSFDDEQYYQKVKHHKPISVGMQVGVKVSPRLRLNTGLVYTYVSSDFTGTANDSRTVTKQTLHYIGIPLNLGYEVWGTKNFHTYVTVGGEGAFNVKNHTETDGVETASRKDRMQWSANGSVGVQYDFIPQLGIYAEPGVKYYFDNGSKIENTFKDKKTNFNFQLGLRWNIGK